MKKMKLEIFDPPMCCSSGVCGPNVNSELVKFSSDLEWLKTQDMDIERYNLSSKPAAFVKQKSVKEALEKEGNECLPIVLVNGAIISKGVYPSRDELMGFLGIKSDKAESFDGNKGEDSKNDIVCGPGCSCGKPSGNKKAKIVICLIVLLAVCSILVYKTKNTKQITLPNTETTFAAPTVNLINEQVTDIDKQDSAVKSVEDKIRIGEYLDSLSLLNTVAINQDAVFVFIPAKQDEIVKKEILDAVASAEQKLKSSNISIGLYTLRFNLLSKEYANIAAQLTLPGILVMSKGKGTGTVSGEITEMKLLQAYVASSRAGGCGASSSCGPSTPGCGPSVPAPAAPTKL